MHRNASSTDLLVHLHTSQSGIQEGLFLIRSDRISLQCGTGPIGAPSNLNEPWVVCFHPWKSVSQCGRSPVFATTASHLFRLADNPTLLNLRSNELKKKKTASWWPATTPSSRKKTAKSSLSGCAASVSALLLMIISWMAKAKSNGPRGSPC